MFPDVHHPRTPRWKVVNVFIISAIAVYVISMGSTISQIVSLAGKDELKKTEVKILVLLSVSLIFTLINTCLASIGIYYPLLCALYSLILTGLVDIVVDVVLILSNTFALSVLPSLVVLLSLYTAIDELKRANHII